MRLCTSGVFSTAIRCAATGSNPPIVFAAAVASSSRRALKLRIDPRPGYDSRPDMRTNPGLEIFDDLVETCRVDIALLGQDRLKCLHPELHFGQLGAVIMCVVICRHGGIF